MFSYIGDRINGKPEVKKVIINGPVAYLNPRLDLRKHSPDHFDWGYAGPGPAQLALAILADCLGDVTGQAFYHWFKHEVIALLPTKNFVLDVEDIRHWFFKHVRNSTEAIERLLLIIQELSEKLLKVANEGVQEE